MENSRWPMSRRLRNTSQLPVHQPRSLNPVQNFSSFRNMKTDSNSLLCVHFVNFMQKTGSKYNLSVRYDKMTLRANKMPLMRLWIYLSY
jgi:hypothetical protein